jgi:hypothetical protein
MTTPFAGSSGPPELLPVLLGVVFPARGRCGCSEPPRPELARRAPGGRAACSPTPQGSPSATRVSESGFQDVVGIAFQLVVLIFVVGLLVVSRRVRESLAPAQLAPRCAGNDRSACLVGYATLA